MIKELKQRHSPLLFKAKKVSEAKLKNCLEAARWAPSCSNNQPWKFILIEDERKISKLAPIFPRGNQWALKAPLVGFIVSKPELDCITGDNNNIQYFQYGCGLAMMSFIIQGEAEGLKTHQMAGYKEAEAKKILKVPHDFRVIVAFAMGYEEKLREHKGAIEPRLLEKIKSKKRIRKPLKEIYSMNKY